MSSARQGDLLMLWLLAEVAFGDEDPRQGTGDAGDARDAGDAAAREQASASAPKRAR